MKIWRYSLSTRIEGKGELIKKSDAYFETLEVHGFSPKTIETYAFVLITFFRWIKSDWPRFQKFTQKDLQDWMIVLSKQNKSPSSINQRLCCVRAFYRFCFGKDLPHAAGVLYPKGVSYGPRRRGYLGISPVSRKGQLELRVKRPKRLMDPMRPPEVDRFLADIQRYRDLGITLVMLLCGLRRQEVTLLRVADVNFHQSSIRVMGKGRRERFVPMPFCLMEVLARYVEVERPTNSNDDRFFVVLQGARTGGAMTNAGIRSLFRKRRERLELPMARPHQFRHVFASDLARSGVPLTTIQRLLGHADPKTSLIYIELFIEDIKTDYDRAMKNIEERYAALSK
jgi:integrase/recombinase XerC